MDCIYIHNEIAAWYVLGGRIGEHGTQGVTQDVASFRLQNKVEAVDALETGDGCGGGAEHADLIQMRRLEPTARELRPARMPPPASSPERLVGQHAEWRIVHRSPELQFLGYKSPVVVRGGASDGIVVRMVRLHQHRPGSSPRPARPETWVSSWKTRSAARKSGSPSAESAPTTPTSVMPWTSCPFGDHLRPNQQIDLARETGESAAAPCRRVRAPCRGPSARCAPREKAPADVLRPAASLRPGRTDARFRTWGRASEPSGESCSSGTPAGRLRVHAGPSATMGLWYVMAIAQFSHSIFSPQLRQSTVKE